MNRKVYALVGAASLALGACGGQGDDALAENAQENMESQADSLDALAGNAANEAEAESLGNQAEQLRDAGDNAEDRIDDADVDASNQAEVDQAVNGM